ncbi:uncharacterized protein METZ01_LOCUS174549 [marine metagenome]|uniref:Uncharacterized protein n=1 Tax=marine metagenome TaxID=408172 RepID=A0A382C6G1_9ZZZZ
MILDNPFSLTSRVAVSHSLFATNTSLNKLALNETLSISSYVSVSTGIVTLFVLIDE